MARNALFLCSIHCLAETEEHPGHGPAGECATGGMTAFKLHHAASICWQRVRQGRPAVPVAGHAQARPDFSAHRFRARSEGRHVRRARYV